MRKRAIKDVFKIMYPVIGGNALTRVIEGYVAIITATIVGSFANAALSGNMDRASKDIWTLAITLLVGVIGVPFITLINNVFLFKLALKHDRVVLNNFMDKAYEKAILYEVGDISYRLEADPNNLRWIIIHICTISLEIITVSLGLFYMIFKINILYGAVCLLVGIFPVIVAFFSGKLEKKYEASKKKYEGELRNLQGDICFNFLFIKLYNMKNIMIKNFSKSFSNYYEGTLKKYIYCSEVSEFLNRIFKILAQIVVLILGAYLVSKNRIEAGAVASMMIYLEKLEAIYTNVGNLIKKIILLPQCLDRVSELYVDKETSGDIKISGVESLVCENLCFGFQEESNIFKSLSLEVNKGEKLAIKGENGSGKSTLIKVLSGLYGGYEGQVKINDCNLKEIDIKTFRDSISYMEQDPFIFKGTVWDNVAIANLKASKQGIERCLEYVGLTDLINKETETLGGNLSGGEKQKISIARAMLRNKDIIFMDEPFNNLDRKGRELVEDILKDKSKTIVYITHDLELLKYGDGVLEM